jgi:tetratricopeptide (TPR) repeat protein
VAQARAVRATTDGDPAEALALLRRCVTEFERTGDLRHACIQRNNVGYAYLELGHPTSAETELRTALQQAERLRIFGAAAGIRQNLCLALGRLGKTAEARALGEQALRELLAQKNRRMLAAAHYYLAEVLLGAGETEKALEHARAAVEAATGNPQRAYALATVARVELARGHSSKAHRAAHEARAILRAMEATDEGDALIRLTYAETLRAEGRRSRATQAIVAARSRLMKRAHKITDPAWRRSFLEGVPENARTLELADAWLAEAPPSSETPPSSEGAS